MGIAVWGSDDDVSNALSESRVLLQKIREWDNGDFLHKYIESHNMGKISDYLHVGVTAVVDLGNKEFALDKRFSISPTWTIFPEYPVVDQHLMVLDAQLQPLPLKCKTGMLPTDVQDAIVGLGAEARLSLPSTLAEYIAIHDALRHPIEVRFADPNSSNSLVAAYLAIVSVDARGTIEIVDPQTIPISWDDTSGGFDNSSIHELCLVRQSARKILESAIPSSWIAIGVLGFDQLDAQARDGGGHNALGVLILLAIEPDYYKLASELEAITGHDALTGSDAFAFRDQYPAVSMFVDRRSVRATLSINALHTLLQELNDVARGSLPLLNSALPVKLVPAVGFPILFVLHLYIFFARRTLLMRSIRRRDGSWQDEAWVQSFYGAVSFRACQEWLPTASMVVMLIGLFNPSGAVRTEAPELSVGILFLLLSFVLSCQDIRLTFKLDSFLRAWNRRTGEIRAVSKRSRSERICRLFAGHRAGL